MGLCKSDAGIATRQIDRPLLPVGACEVLLPVVNLWHRFTPPRRIDAADGTGAGITGGLKVRYTEPHIDEPDFTISRLQ